MNKLAIVTGVTGQDGSYLSEYLCGLGYSVLGVKRRSSTDTTQRLAGLCENDSFHMIEGDVSDYASMSGVFSFATEWAGRKPDEVYNLAAQSHVATSFNQPLLTWEVNAGGVLNILEIMRQQGYEDAKFYQASTSEMFGTNYIGRDKLAFQNEDVSFHPRSHYAIAKVAAHNAVRLYREAYDIFGCCGILFNHESPRRGENFVTRKISKYVASLFHAKRSGKKLGKLGLGNMDARRDWGHAQDYVRAMYMMLQRSEPDDYVIATGETHSVAEFCEVAFGCIDEDYRDWTYVDEKFVRPSDVPHLLGDASKAHVKLRWHPQVTFQELVREMVAADIRGE